VPLVFVAAAAGAQLLVKSRMAASGATIRSRIDALVVTVIPGPSLALERKRIVRRCSPLAKQLMEPELEPRSPPQRFVSCGAS
jgi:hypothetical protein